MEAFKNNIFYLHQLQFHLDNKKSMTKLILNKLRINISGGLDEKYDTISKLLNLLKNKIKFQVETKDLVGKIITFKIEDIKDKIGSTSRNKEFKISINKNSVIWLKIEVNNVTVFDKIIIENS